MKVTIEYKIVKTWWEDTRPVLADESLGNWISSSLAMHEARKIANEYALYGADCKKYPELDILNGDDKLVIHVYPVALVDGVEVEVTQDNFTEPIQTLTISKQALKNYEGLEAIRNSYNHLNQLSGNVFTKLH